ncbi:glycosyltransferase family 2 protein [Halobacillus sp. A5]|uniref:glycosyltransferase family 2 protein n=1 Tax=Halobacillus sp. A5 TaxID=2880263 RepID=UPI0020A6C878|nr:glycosyltransferase family 2 protein [Halobacillus sp. A5]MCP3029525.1 glycosyltransferase family 2 protein [Halobacillus sp. A5]
MLVFLSICFYLSAFIIFWAMIGYPLSMRVLRRFNKQPNIVKDYSYKPSVTLMVVAHNEEKVIKEKLENISKLAYPRDKIEVLITSDNSTDRTNEIVESFIERNSDINIRLFKVKKRQGKTNAQNEAQKTVKNEILIMTDANSMLERNSVKELVASFSSQDVSYVCGKLTYINEDSSSVSKSETTYWDGNLRLRAIESDIQTISAGNGALYACRNEEYYDFSPLRSHDGIMPIYFALRHKKAIYNPDAIAFEKAGEVIEDEFKRKVRMNRGILYYILPDIRILNFFKYKWFSYFYLGHRTSRYLLWISHLVVLLTNMFLISESWFYVTTFGGQLLFYLLALVKLLTKTNNRYLTMIYYYCITIFAQWAGVFKILTGKAKPFWEKAESTR